MKINYFVHRELLTAKLLLFQCLNHLYSFCSVKLKLIIIKEQNLYFSWLCILGIQLRFLTSHIYVEHCSVIPLTRLCYTLSWSLHQHVVTLVQLWCKGNAWYSFFHMLIVMILCFFKNIMQDMRWWYTLSLPHSTMTWGHDLQYFRPTNHLNLSKHVFL